MVKSVLIVALLVLSISALSLKKTPSFVQLKSTTQQGAGTPDFVTIETGTLNVMAESEDDWHTVSLKNKFDHPVVLMQIATYNGGHPVHPRLKNVNASSFQFKLEEFDYLDEWHTEETVYFLVAEAGEYDLACGGKMIVGTQADMHETWVTIPLGTTGVPTVMTQCQTHEGGHAVVTRHLDVTKDSFQVKLQEQESQGAHPNAEIVGYFAIDQGICDNIYAETGDDVFEENWTDFTYAASYNKSPYVFAQMQTTDGGDTAGIRMKNTSVSGCQVMVEEETSNDSETDHTTEKVGFFVLEVPNTLSLELEEHCHQSQNPCDYIWDCDSLWGIVEQAFNEWDTDSNGNINHDDYISNDHYETIVGTCDANNDGQVDMCEMYACVVSFENEWRDYNCPSAGHVQCDCKITCDGAWSCADIHEISKEIVELHDSNGDAQITMDDNIDPEHFGALQSECDENNDGVIDACEVHSCVIFAENSWRDENCAGFGHVICDCPFYCPYAWTCDDINEIATYYMSSSDTNNDGVIDNYDNIAEEHLHDVLDTCDTNGDLQVDGCELQDCLENHENLWRDENCPGYGHVFCECTFVTFCAGAWDCQDIHAIAQDVMMYDTNADGQINLGDEIEGEHLDILMDQCDMDGNGSLDSCEIHACVVMCENQWRDTECPELGHVFCECPFYMSECIGAWSCDDVQVITADVMYYYDTNSDGQINFGDDIDPEHYDLLMTDCDFNGDGQVDACEVYMCVVIIENEWREAHCPDYGLLYCETQVCAQCDGAWTCEDIYYISNDIMMSLDTNGDGQINLGDNVDAGHLADMNMSCDYNGDETLDACEIHQCMIDTENMWRDQNCPDYGDVFCACPFNVQECQGAWSCSDIEDITLEVQAYYDTNVDGAINPEDVIDAEHYSVMVEFCDFNNDGTIDACELHDCILQCENEWRAEYCPDFGFAYCACPFSVPVCDGAWNCSDIITLTEDFMIAYDTNNDGQINLGDQIDAEHLDIVVSECDEDGNGTVDACEVHNCMVSCENAWRAEYCPESEDLYCTCPFTVVYCDGAWSCEDIYHISQDVMEQLDQNGDGQINLGDNIDPEHMAELTYYCDFNGNGMLDACEIHSCVVMCENTWRDEVCPNYGHVFCDCPFFVATCEGAWECEDIEAIAIETIVYYDTNMDGSINPEDNIDTEHYNLLLADCDSNNDGNLDACEIHTCIEKCENEWRAEYCPDYGFVYCQCPFAVHVCEGAWNCADIVYITDEVMMSLDTNYDGQINLEDDIEYEHYTLMVEYCDLDYNGSLNACEIHECVVKCENEWRAEYCPESEDLYCAEPYLCYECPGAWNCEDIYNITTEIMAFYDTNGDGSINLGDDIEPSHLEEINMYCDYSGDQQVDSCEAHHCIVMIENEWRAENCPGYGEVFCDCPFYVPVCEGAWDCEDITNISIDVIAYYDTNMDGAINPEDVIEADHYQVMVEYCDFNNDGTVDACEVHDCIEQCENEWRDEYCPDYGYVYCSCPFATPECDGAWNCADITYITEDFMMAYDTNADGQVNLGDNIDAEHMQILTEQCDQNGDYSLDACEVFECVIVCENEWRAEYCPDSEDLYCTCPYTVPTCDGAWDCEDIYGISLDVLAYYDSNGDGSINLADEIDPEHLVEIQASCDYNGDENIDSCEVHQCIVDIENTWRDEYCPAYGHVFCDCPFVVVAPESCPGEWNCEDIYYISSDMLAYYDTNGDGSVGFGDNIDPAHVEEINMYCDYNGNGETDSCEMHQCIVDVENTWRAEYCPTGYPMIYCDCPFIVVDTCDGAWTCDDIEYISADILSYYDTNMDGQISWEDNIDESHLAEINMNCDFDQNGATDACEVHQCIVIIENDWRSEYCPGYAHVYCDCPFVVLEGCPGEWNCSDIEYISLDVLNYYDTNYDGSINLEDTIESEHLDILLEYCDYNNDGTVDSCEVHQCIIDCENEWRAEYCPEGYPMVYCECPFWVAECAGEWNCDDIYYISTDVINYYDTNYDGTINLEDSIDETHLAELNAQCDYNGDNELDYCEIHQCVVDIENSWRDEYCPDSEHVYCDCPF